MTIITIPLNAGLNYISFPAISSENFGTIFTNSAIKNNILSFERYDAIIPPFSKVSDSEYIEEGIGYRLEMSSPGDISYDGITYSLSFNQLKSKLLIGWNLIGPGYDSLDIPNWCILVDATTGFPVSRLYPNKAYWVYYNDCIQPTTEPIVFISAISLATAMISLYLSMSSKYSAKEL